jgi:hypothetical protein
MGIPSLKTHDLNWCGAVTDQDRMRKQLPPVLVVLRWSSVSHGHTSELRRWEELSMKSGRRYRYGGENDNSGNEPV